MATVQTAVTHPVHAQDVALGLIAISGTNPRRSFDPAAMKELADSVVKHGVIQPVLVRPWTATAEDVKRTKAMGAPAKFGPGDQVYQLVAGERRFRASIDAKRADVPCTVRDLTDMEALEFQIIENLQRRDVDPLDEADGYQALLAQGLKLEDISNRIGKSISYVSGRVKLASLSADGQELLRKGWISAGHAILVARVDPQDHDRALRVIFAGEYPSPEQKKMELMALAKQRMDPGDEYWGAEFRPMSEKALREWIKENINLDLKKAPWKLDDAALYPEAGACVTCPNKSGNNQALFAEIADGDGKCMKPACFAEKRQRFIQIELDRNKAEEKPLVPISEKSSYTAPKEGAKLLKQGQWVEAKKGDCPDTVQAIYMDGETAGAKKYVCGNVKCKKHRHSVMMSSGGGHSTNYKEQEEKRKEADRKREAAVLEERQIRFGRAVGVVEKIEGLTDELLQAVGHRLATSIRGNETLGKLLAHAGVDGKLSGMKVKSKDFARALVCLLLAEHAHPWYEATSGRKEFNETICALGPQFKKMLAQWEAEPKKAQPSAKPLKHPKANPAKKAAKPKHGKKAKASGKVAAKKGRK